MRDDAQPLIDAWVRPEVRAAAPYHVADARGLIKLDAMENPWAWPAPLNEALRARVDALALNRYPDPRGLGVQAALRQAFGIAQRWDILLGNGSDEIIQILLSTLARPGFRVLAPVPGFVMYRMIAEFLRLPFEEIALGEDFGLDAGAVLDAVRAGGPAIVFLACPNNPSGNLFDEDAVRAVLEHGDALFVIDEAYLPFSSRDHLAWLEEYPNLLIMRTLSKLGLAGLRLGYLVGDPRWIAEFDKLRLPYNIGTLNQAATEVALEQYAVLRAQASLLVAERERLAASFACDERLECWPSAANFLLVRPRRAEARAVHAAMRARGVLVKCLDGAHPRLANCLRFTIGTPEENAVLLAALDAALREQGQATR